MEFKSKLKARAITCQSKEIVANVLEFITKERENGEPLIPLADITGRVAAAIGSVDPPRTEGLLRLYSNKFCPFAERVLLVLAAKKIPHEVVNINLQNKPEWYTKVNPAGKVPCLLDGSKVIVESLDIAAYLDEKFPENPLSPSDPAAKKRDQEFIETLGPAQRIIFKIMSAKDDDPTTPDQWAELFADAWKGFENELSQRGTQFLGGAKPGMVDYMIWPQPERFDLIKLKLGLEIPFKENQIPLLRKWRRDMLKTPVCQELAVDVEALWKVHQARANNLPAPYDG